MKMKKFRVYPLPYYMRMTELYVKLLGLNILRGILWMFGVKVQD
jgi:hypothetical protein